VHINKIVIIIIIILYVYLHFFSVLINVCFLYFLAIFVIHLYWKIYGRNNFDCITLWTR